MAMVKDEMPALLISLLILTACLRPASCAGPVESRFTRIKIRACLKPKLLHDPDVAAGSEILCAAACTQRGSRCQGFWMPGGRCQIAEFDRCSHMMNVASCNQTAWAFVRKQENLPDGQLCPPGYGHDYLGSTYKIFDVSSWTDGLARCSSEPGLSKFADAMDRAEVDHLHRIKSSVDPSMNFYVGGQRTGPAASGTWHWQACSSAFLPELWVSPEPTDQDVDSYLRAGIWHAHTAGLDDLTEASERKAMCECVNPFAL